MSVSQSSLVKKNMSVSPSLLIAVISDICIFILPQTNDTTFTICVYGVHHFRYV